MTRRAFIRDDWSTFHAVEYDPDTGERVRGFTFQGHDDASCWTRGQAWAIYGFAESAAATGDPKHLAVAERLAAYYLERMGERLVPFWDFDDPAIPDAPLDSATAAIVASAFLTMGALQPDVRDGTVWHDRALSILDALSTSCLATDDAHRGLLRHGCYSKPHGIGTDSAVMFGDWFFAEALCGALYPGRLKPVPRRLPRG